MPTIRFNASIESKAVLTLPKSTSAKLSFRDIKMVEGVIDSFPFRLAIRSDGRGSQWLKINASMFDVIDANVGDTVAVEITRVDKESETRVPSDLKKALAATPGAADSWADITPMARRDWIFSICTAKLVETRRRRIEKAVDMLSSGKRRLCCFPGIKWMMKENAKTCGMWLPLKK